MTIIQKPLKVFVGLFLGLFLTACNNAGETVTMQSVDSNTWDKSKTQLLNFEILDHQNPKNIIFIIRNNNDYPYSNLRVFGTIIGQDKKILRKDTLNFTLAKPNGQWLGSGFGDVKEVMYQYKTDFQFPKNGHYQFEVTQAMRNEKLKGIEDVGIKIVNVKP